MQVDLSGSYNEVLFISSEHFHFDLECLIYLGNSGESRNLVICYTHLPTCMHTITRVRKWRTVDTPEVSVGRGELPWG